MSPRIKGSFCCRCFRIRIRSGIHCDGFRIGESGDCACSISPAQSTIFIRDGIVFPSDCQFPKSTFRDTKSKFKFLSIFVLVTLVGQTKKRLSGRIY